MVRKLLVWWSRRSGSYAAPAPPPPGPVVLSVTPLAGAVDRAITVNAKATFGSTMDATSITTSTFELRDSVGTLVPAVVSYDAATLKATLNPNADLSNGTQYTATLKSGAAGVKTAAGTPLASDYVWSFNTVVAPGDPAQAYIVGYGSNTTGGAGGTVYTVSTFADFKTRVLQTGTRIVKIASSAGNLNGLGVELVITNNNLTIDGSGWGGSLIRCNIRVRASNVIFTQMRIRPGASVDNEQSGGCININPGAGNTLSNILIERCSLSWATDVCLNTFNSPNNVTIQNSIIGPGIYEYVQDSFNNNTGTPAGTINKNGYGSSFHGDDPYYASRYTFYRNYFPHNFHRNLRGYNADRVDYVNNVVYNWGNKPVQVNMRGVNFFANILKPGGNTDLSYRNGFNAELASDVPTYYQNSLYYPTGSTAFAQLTIGYTATDYFGVGQRRTTPYPAGATGPYNATPQTATTALAATVVAEAGPTIVDSWDQQFKDNFTNTTGSFFRENEGGLPAPHVPW